MPLVTAKLIYKTYRLGRVDVPVLRGASLDVEEGECVAVLGASGSGKSTLLHILGGLDRPDRMPRSGFFCPRCGTETKDARARACRECGFEIENGGEVHFRGQDLRGFGQRALNSYRNLDVGFVFQFYHLLPELRVLENVTIGARVRYGVAYALHAREVNERASELLKTFGLGHRLNHRPSELSGGERQRVAIARALLNNPPLLLADEPTGNLDRKTGHAILDSLAEHRASTRRTMVLVTHDLEVAARADRIVRLDDGRIVSPEAVPASGPAESLAAG